MKKQTVFTEKQQATRERNAKIVTLYKSMQGSKYAIYDAIKKQIEPPVSISLVQKVCEKWEKLTSKN